jgi:Fe-S-cluster containining protein
MRCSNCGICCAETEMLLATKDIKRLENRGFSRNYFAEIDKEGYAVLRNQNGYCVFYDLKTRRCSVYDNRPLGCRIYPVVLDEKKGIIFDKICDSYKSITAKEKKVKGKKVIKLLEEIDAEAENRLS